ncbi:MAG: HD domain-containing protein, partial [Gammaproteobacteria bacterium]|nr:HD domain-containing protein [Gammaproteobacteria bacterium]
QYDLFHVYTVDQHTLFVLRNLRRFLLPEFKDEFPLCSEVAPLIPKPELLYLAALFHDIAKGRGGDHSTLGAQEARGFCLQHDLSRYDTELVVWLVQNHLLMSSTAQHKDIEDPEIINGFAQQVADKNRLRYLYLLTVADMYGTNPKIWNSWKESLLGELYNQTLRAFARGLENPLDRRERIKEKQSLARKALLDSGIPADAIEQLWQQTADDYFLRYKDEEIQFHTKTILSFREKHPSDPLVLLREIGDSGTSDIFINATVQRFMFYRITATLDRLNLNIMEARIVSGSRGFTMDTYSVTESDNSPITDPERIKEIESQIFNTLTQDSLPKLITRATTGRQAKHFTIPTDVTFTQDERNHRTIMEITATDRPGLLSRIAFAMKECEVELQNAKVSTVGAQVEDVFFITDKNGKSLTEQEQLANLRAAIKSQLDSDREPALQSI